MRLGAVLLLLSAVAPPALGQSLLDWTRAEVGAVARHGPWPPAPVHDSTNRVSGNPAAISLGRSLFQDARLSNRGKSCESCHQPQLGWRDGLARGQGTVELDRRTPSLWNVGYRKWFGWDGAADSLWMQSIRPILDDREMHGSRERTAALLREDKQLACGYRRAFGTAPDGTDEKLMVDAAKALAAFQETLVTPRTTFDDFRDALVRGDTAAIRYPERIQRGLRLFIGQGNCSACHFGPTFTNGEFGDVGVPFFVKRPGEVDTGRFGGIERLRSSPYNLLGAYNDDPSAASTMRTRHVERQHRNFGEFRVPGLRQVGRSGPYMHDGGVATLEAVVDHYSTVSPDRLHSDGVPIVRALQMTPQEKGDLVSFLRSLDAEPVALPPALPLCP
jgi:cytochrome c peroxidase